VLEQSCRLARLSIGLAVCLSVSQSVGRYDQWKNGWLDLDAVWGAEWGRSSDWCFR